MKCEICDKSLEPVDYGDGVFSYTQTYEYRGRKCCDSCLPRLIKKVDEERNQGIFKEREAE